MESLILLQKLHVGTTTLQVLLELDFVGNHERLALGVDGLLELGGDGVVSSLVLEDETLVAFDTLVDDGLLDLPVADKAPLLLGLSISLLLGVGRLPSGRPVVGELLKERGLDVGRLYDALVEIRTQWRLRRRTVKVGLTISAGTASSAMT